MAHLVRALDCVWDAQMAQDRALAAHFLTFLIIYYIFDNLGLSFTLAMLSRL